MTSTTSTETFSLGILGNATVNNNSRVAIPDDVAKSFALAATYFSARSNRHTLTIPLENVPTDKAADLLRKQIRQYADDHGLTAGLPKWVAEHTVAAKVDPETGKVITPERVIPDNGYPHEWNVSRNVTFRFTPTRDKSTAAGPVTVSQVADAAESSKAGAESAAQAAEKIAAAAK